MRRLWQGSRRGKDARKRPGARHCLGRSRWRRRKKLAAKDSQAVKNWQQKMLEIERRVQEKRERYEEKVAASADAQRRLAAHFRMLAEEDIARKEEQFSAAAKRRQLSAIRNAREKRKAKIEAGLLPRSPSAADQALSNFSSP